MIKQEKHFNLASLNGKRLLLASGSPRRRQLLKDLDLEFDIAPTIDIDESYPKSIEPWDVAPYLSKLKANAYRSFIRNNDIVITADTVVICENKVLGKPVDNNEAKQMLHRLSGRTHSVITGVTIMDLTHDRTFAAETDVEFASLTDEEIDFYVNRFNPTDKAGAYGIQEWIGCIGVKHINGSFYNVMGLPLQRLFEELKRF